LAVTHGDAQTWWLVAVTLVGISSMAGSINYITTVIAMRAPGLSWLRLPMTVWGLFVTAIIQALALPVLTAGGVMQLSDRLAGTMFFAAEGQPLLWQHLFWFYSHPAVYVMILPAMGIVSDILSVFARKPLFGYVPMVVATAAIGLLGFLVWGHHMFTSGMNPAVGMVFALATLLIAVPSAIKTFNWIATLWGGSIQFTTPMLFALSFVSMFIIGGLSGIFLGASTLDIYLHDTYFIVAHFHYVLFGGSVMAIFAGIYYWYPKMFGRPMNESLGKLHFVLTFVFFNATFLPMHFLGLMGFPRRVADVVVYESLNNTPPLNAFITISAIGMGLAQLPFVANFFGSMFGGRSGDANPWKANTLEWAAPSPPPHGNFISPVHVYRGPYEYSVPGAPDDFIPQSQAP
jgi:cytochrome c oxidase subunit 1